MASESCLKAIEHLIGNLSPTDLKKVIYRCTEERSNKLPKSSSISVSQNTSQVPQTPSKEPQVPGLQRNAKSRGSERSSSPLLRLPAELRAMIYSHVVTPGMAEAHVTKYKVPALLNVNHETREDFAAFYYSRTIFRVETLNCSSWAWEECKDAWVFRAMFESRGVSWARSSLCAIDSLRRSIESDSEHFADINTSQQRDGMLSWVGGPEDMAVSATFCCVAKRSWARKDRGKYQAKARGQTHCKLEMKGRAALIGGVSTRE